MRREQNRGEGKARFVTKPPDAVVGRYRTTDSILNVSELVIDDPARSDPCGRSKT